MPASGFIVDGAAMARVLNSPSGLVMRWVLVKGQQVQTLAHAKVGKKTGKLAASLVKRPGVSSQGPFVRVGSSLPYARVHHDGGRPHVIVARKAKVLAFYSPKAGRVVFAKSVNHPGNKPNPYLLAPLRQVLGR